MALRWRQLVVERVRQSGQVLPDEKYDEIALKLFRQVLSLPELTDEDRATLQRMVRQHQAATNP